MFTLISSIYFLKELESEIAFTKPIASVSSKFFESETFVFVAITPPHNYTFEKIKRGLINADNLLGL